jgi:uncharacterized membrane protein
VTQEPGAPAPLLPRRFSIGEVFAVSFAVFGRNLTTFLVIAFIVSIPYIAIQTWSDLRPIQPGNQIGAGSGVGIVQLITFALVQAALTFGTFQDLRGQQTGLATCLSRGLAASSKVALAALLFSLLLVLATIALIVPGIVLYVMWWVYVPVIVVEGLGATDSLRRSKALTKGRRWPIFALVAIVLVVELAILMGLEALLNNAAASIATTLLAVAFTAYTSVMTAVGYYYLRAEKEGILVEDIARVFD